MSVMTSTIDCDYPPIGYMPMPPGFKYRDVLKKGRPQHDRLSLFRLKHPQMPCSRRAKIFAPFDALRGFNEAVASKEVGYTGKPELSEEEKERLDKKLTILHKLTYNRKTARKNAPHVTVTYYQPCSDEQSDAYGTDGTIESISGICSRVDTQITYAITIDHTNILLDDIISITIQTTPELFSEEDFC